MNNAKHHLIFFLDDFHHGAVNHVLHFAGFLLLGYGVGAWNWFVVVLSPLVMESGHLYNYTRGIHREHAVKIVPLQIVGWGVFVALGYLITRFL